MYIRKEFKGDINTLSTEDLNNIEFRTLEDGELKGITIDTVKRLTMHSLVNLIGGLGYGYLSNASRAEHEWRDAFLQGVVQAGLDYKLKVSKHGIVKDVDGALIENFILQFVDCLDHAGSCNTDTFEYIGEHYPAFILKYFSLLEPDDIEEIIDDSLYIEAITNKTLVVFESGSSCAILHNLIRRNDEFGVKLLGEKGHAITKRMFNDNHEYIIVANADLCRRLGFPYIDKKISKKRLRLHDACRDGRTAFDVVLNEIDSTASSFTWDQLMEYIKQMPKIRREDYDYFDWLIEYLS